MKKIAGVITGALGIVCTAAGLLLVLRSLIMNHFVKDKPFSESVGIIGGADEPTAAFIASRTVNDPAIIVIAIIAGMLLIAISLILLFNKKR